jgi:predicted nucleic acid-binding protein
MGIDYLWDTNIAVYYLQQHLPSKAEKLIDEMLEINTPRLSVISEIELLCWKMASEKDIKIINAFLMEVYIIELEKDIKLKTVEIRKTYTLKLPDAIIAATALVNNLTIITRNTKDFTAISQLKILDPFIL